ncbi:MAG: hypothetical protein JW996_04025, partial [Candidatus Cloacimonetes bacterium]|nr:hypothetical protein [Candidatus Cloacimonadota bacterium]
MKNFIIISILIFSMSLLFSDLVELSENQGLPLFKAESAGLEWTRVEFHLDGYLAEQVEVDGTEYISISYPEEGEFIEIGMPALPRFSRLIAIPDEGEVSVDIVYTDTEILSDIKVFPRQNLRSESQPLRESFTIDQAYYNNGAIFPGKIVELDSPAILRDYRVVSLTINPFNYDPVKQELEIVKSVEVIVQTNGRGGDNIRTGERKISRFFEPIYQSVILNYETAGSRDEEYLQPNYLFIYPNNSTILPLVNELAEWKHQKGFHIVTASTTVTGTSLSSIKSYLQNAYNNWEITPEFVCLVGDAGGTFSIPTSNSGGGDGDQYYALLEGNDILADIIIGRLSYSSAYELQTILGKIFNYERNPYL